MKKLIFIIIALVGVQSNAAQKRELYCQTKMSVALPQSGMSGLTISREIPTHVYTKENKLDLRSKMDIVDAEGQLLYKAKTWSQLVYKDQLANVSLSLLDKDLYSMGSSAGVAVNSKMDEHQYVSISVPVEPRLTAVFDRKDIFGRNSFGTVEVEIYHIYLGCSLL